MNYRNTLSPWCVFRKEASLFNVCVARFRRRDDACAYARILESNNHQSYEVAFDVNQNSIISPS
ncbi:hypothetical protein [Trichormus variabilis]|uniref:hypothetical protein n=1 Tax=Anabaena variabilis TaxID=264691 RepID=UPI000F8C8E2A|nr:hypothetical protein [Trichormus variabilis]MBD2628833.1 hypothetical protein [Trichormus variabilis FACHB-164]